MEGCESTFFTMK